MQIDGFKQTEPPCDLTRSFFRVSGQKQKRPSRGSP